MHAQHPGSHLLFREVVENALGRATWLGRENLPYSCGNSTGLEPVSPLSLSGTLLAIYLKMIVAPGRGIVKQICFNLYLLSRRGFF